MKQAAELQRMHDGRDDEDADDENHENCGRGADAVLLHLQDEAHDDDHHHQCVGDGQDACQPKLK